MDQYDMNSWKLEDDWMQMADEEELNRILLEQERQEKKTA